MRNALRAFLVNLRIFLFKLRVILVHTFGMAADSMRVAFTPEPREEDSAARGKVYLILEDLAVFLVALASVPVYTLVFAAKATQHAFFRRGIR